MIEEPALIEAILTIRTQVDFLWQFFVTAHIAIFALLFIYDQAVDSLNAIARAFALARSESDERGGRSCVAQHPPIFPEIGKNTARPSAILGKGRQKQHVVAKMCFVA
jgi:hypothetical protein